MSARADFTCVACGEEMELPLRAAACPCCGGLLERRFTTAPAVLRGSAQGAEPITPRLVEHAAADEYDAQRAATRPPPATDRTHTRPLSLASIPLDARQGSRQYAAPVLQLLQGRAPRPRRE